MGHVRVLPPEIVSKIAAGEVIERPASVIKELLENALDAQAQSIAIEVRDAGRSLIRLTDTGCGIAADDMEHLFLRHATSKLSEMEDLFAITSLGFRGEALYSIASIADITLRSRTARGETGWEIHVRGTERIGLSPVTMAPGTEIEIRELFFNTPARRKFLKADATEMHHIVSTATPYALLNPRTRFTLKGAQKLLIDAPVHNDHAERAAHLLPVERDHLLSATRDFPDQRLSISLVLGDITIQRPKKDLQYIFVNDRPVQNHVISYHLNQVYRLIMPPDAHPFFMVFITLPAQDLDVNVHPTKREIKIKNESLLLSVLRSFCEQTLISRSPAKQLSETPFTFAPAQKIVRFPNTPAAPAQGPSEQPVLFARTAGTAPAPARTTGALKERWEHARFIGSFLSKYLFFEAEKKLLVMDQHAAQERVTYESIVRQIDAGTLETQQLLTPVILKVAAQELLLWNTAQEYLEKIGISTTLWDKEHLAIHTHPPLIRDPERAVRMVLSEGEQGRYDLDTVARRACRSSVMAGDPLTSQEANALRKRLLACNTPFVCPHGRPTVIETDERIFEKEFLRT